MQKHFAANSKFDFRQYIKRSMEDDFKVVVGVRSLSNLNPDNKQIYKIAFLAYLYYTI